METTFSRGVTLERPGRHATKSRPAVRRFTVHGNNGVINVEGLGFRGGVGRPRGTNLVSSLAFLNLAFPSLGNDDSPATPDARVTRSLILFGDPTTLVR